MRVLGGMRALEVAVLLKGTASGADKECTCWFDAVAAVALLEETTSGADNDTGGLSLLARALGTETCRGAKKECDVVLLGFCFDSVGSLLLRGGSSPEVLATAAPCCCRSCRQASS